MSIFSFCNQKGGVGKTTTAVNFATFIAKSGYKTLLIDMDAQANATSGLGMKEENTESTAFQLLVDNSDPASLVQQTIIENLFLIPSNQDLAGAEVELVSKIGREYCLRNQLRKLEQDYDFVLIDSPPSLGLITINCLTASNYIIIPLQCEYYALEGLSQLINTHQLIKQNLNESLEIGGVLLTMADFRTNLTQQVIQEVRDFFKDTVFKTVIPRSVKLSEAPSFGKPAIIYDEGNRGTKAYLTAGEEFVKRFAVAKIEEVNNSADSSAQEEAEENKNPETDRQESQATEVSSVENQETTNSAEQDKPQDSENALSKEQAT